MRYYIRRHKADPVKGPYTVEELIAGLEAGTLDPDGLVSSDLGEGEQRISKFRRCDWSPMSEIPEMRRILAVGTAASDELRYAGFWSRLLALLLDLVIMAPLMALSFWVSERYRLFELFYLLPGATFSAFYGVYLVRRFGGTPGKLIVGIQIRKLSGEPVGYREAVFRFLPEFLLGTLGSVALLISVLHMSDSEYHALSVMERARRMIELTPSWYNPLRTIQGVWVWGELIVLLTNRKRRALHDFIAGTVVVHTSPNRMLLAPAPAPAG